MKYSKKVFIDNVKYMISYDCEPEITIKLNNDSSAFIIVYKDHLEVTIDYNETIKLEKVEDLFDILDFDTIVKIEGDIDYEFPVETQSMVVNEKLWIDGILPKQVINKYKKQIAVFSIIYAIGILFVFAYFLITILKVETFDTSAIIACSVFGGTVGIIMINFTTFDIRRSKLIKKYYGIVSEEDKIIAKGLLENIKVVDNNEYDFFDLFHYDMDDLSVKQALKLLIKGKKVYIGIYDPIKLIEQELLTNNTDNKYDDIEFNNYILKFVKLLERNLCDI